MIIICNNIKKCSDLSELNGGYSPKAPRWRLGENGQNHRESNHLLFTIAAREIHPPPREIHCICTWYSAIYIVVWAVNFMTLWSHSVKRFFKDDERTKSWNLQWRTGLSHWRILHGIVIRKHDLEHLVYKVSTMFPKTRIHKMNQLCYNYVLPCLLSRCAAISESIMESCRATRLVLSSYHWKITIDKDITTIIL